MKKIAMSVLVLGASLSFYAGCGSKSSPTSPNAPTNTPVSTGTPTLTGTLTPTSSLTPSATNSATNTATLTGTLTPSSTFTNTSTNSPTNTSTNTATHTATNTSTNTATNTATSTPTATCAGGSFGSSSTPGLTGAVFNGIAVSSYTLGSSGTVMTKGVSVYLNSAGTVLRAFIYADKAGAPDALVVASASQTPVVGWNWIPLSSVPMAPGNYWVGIQNEAADYDVNSSSVSYTTYFEAATPSAPAPNYFLPVSMTNNYMTIQVAYCDAPGSPTFTPPATYTFTPTNTATETPYCSVPNFVGASGQGDGTYPMYQLEMVRNNIPGTNTVKAMGVSVYISVPAGNIRAALYSDNGDTPDILLSSTSLQTAVSGWNWLDFPDTPISPGDYWVAVQADASQVGYDTAVSADSTYINLNPTDPLPTYIDPFSVNRYGFDMAAKMAYCDAGASPTFTPPATYTNTPTFTPTFTASPTPTPLCAGTALGLPSVGANPLAVPAGALGTSRYVFSGTGPVTVFDMSLYLTSISGGSMRMGLYADNSGTPGTLLGQTGYQPMANGWNTIAMTPYATLSGPATYWLAFYISGGATGWADSGGSGDSVVTSYNASGGMPASFPSGSAYPIHGTIKADYCP